MSPRRRQLLRGLAALAASGWLPPATAQGPTAALTAARFASLSTTVTGFAYADAATASTLLRTLATAVGMPTLVRLADLAARTPATELGPALDKAGLARPAATVVTALLSGVVQTAKGPVVVTYDQALAWQAVPWTKPNAVCGGMTDYWSTDPTRS